MDEAPTRSCIPSRGLFGRVCAHEPLRILTRTSCISAVAAPSLVETGSRRLGWWGANGAKGAKNAAVAGFRSKHRTASFARIEELTGVRRHRLSLGEATTRAGDDGVLNHVRLRS